MASSVQQGALLLENAETARRTLRLMMLIRRFEERTEEQYTRARIGGYCHLAIGEEAANVGAISALGSGDYLFASYRDHGAALAIGSDPAAVMAELFGKATGVAGGYGGSMHLVDPTRHFLGGWGIVGGHLPIATGAALALDYQRSNGVVLCQFGDGACNTGAFHEALNLAALWHLPVLFQIVNNQYGMGTSVEMASAQHDLYRRAEAYAMHGERVDGNDVNAVFEATRRLLSAARTERRPSLLETATYRFRGHSVADAGKVYRSPEEIASWRTRDPIRRFASDAEAAGLLDDGDVERLRLDVDQEVSAAIKEAASAPSPAVSELYANVYADPHTAEQYARMDTAAPFGERRETRSWRT